MPLLSSPPAPVTSPIISVANAPSVDCRGCQWLSVAWTVNMQPAQLTYQVVVKNGTQIVYISPLALVAANPFATDGIFLASGSNGYDGAWKIPSEATTAYILVSSLNPANTAPPAAPAVLWTLNGSAD